jgi:hypothetical protein
MRLARKSRLEEFRMFSIGTVIGIIVVFMWFLAVVKIFLLEYYSNTNGVSNIILNTDSKAPDMILLDQYHQNSRSLKLVETSQSLKSRVLPSFYEWLFIRSDEKYNYLSKPYHQMSISLPREAQQTRLTDLKWPPILPNGTIPPSDGFDIMPFSGLIVPRFWEPDRPVLNLGSKVNDQETIFLMIASYRDFQCRETITSAFKKADYPERLFVGAVDQVVPGDIGCLDIDIPCSVDDTQMICKYRNQIAIYKMDASTATGPVTARHIGDRLYRGQYFVMQMDAHCLFVRHWDTSIIKQWRETKNEMAVLRFET